MKAISESERRIKAEMLIAYRDFMSESDPHSHMGTMHFGKILGLRAAAMAVVSIDAMEFGEKINARALRVCR